MDGVVLVELGDQLQQVFLRDVGGEAVELALDADFFAGLALVADVDFAGRIVADEHGREAGDDAVVLDELDRPPRRAPSESAEPVSCRRGWWRAWKGCRVEG